MLHQVRNTEDRFSHNEAHIRSATLCFIAESDLRVKAMRAVEKRLKEDSIPLIYTEDSEEHRTMVYELRDKLEKCGVKVLIVDDDNCPNVTLNWVDFAEKIAKSYRTYLFVVSPLLFKLCHEGKHGDENSFEGLLEKTKGIHLPPILLRNFEALCARNCQKPRLCLVELPERQTDNVRVVDERTEAAGGTSPPNTESTHRVQEQAKRDMRSSCPLSELKQEDTLSSNLIDDYTILSDAKCFRLSHEDLSDDMGSRQVTLYNLSNWLKG